MTDLYDELRSRNSLHEVVSRYVKRLKKTSRGWQCKCPIHSEVNGESFELFTGDDGKERFMCHGAKCQARGDVVDFLRLMGQDPIREGSAPTPRTAPRPSPETATSQPVVVPPPLTFVAPREPLDRSRFGNVVAVFDYYSTDGELLGHVLRLEPKSFRPVRFTQEKGWVMKGFDDPRPLYGLQHLSRAKVVMITEGEGKADVLRDCAQDDRIAVLSISGGAKAAGKADIQPLVEAGLPVTLWPDADEPGIAAMQQLGARLQAEGLTVTILDVSDLAEKEDAKQVVERLGSWPAVQAWIKDRKRPLSEAEPEAAEPIRLDDRRSMRVIEGGKTMRQEKPVQAEDLMPIRRTEYPPLERKPGEYEWMANTIRKVTKKGSAIEPGNSYNWREFLYLHPDTWDLFGWNEFSQQVSIMRRPAWEKGRGEFKPRAMTDIDWAHLATLMQSEGLSPDPRRLAASGEVQIAAQRRPFNPMHDYLHRVRREWQLNGAAPRIEEWLMTYLGAEDTPYHRAVGRSWLIGAVARALDPGCKMDNVLVLEGPQGAGKSTVFAILARAAGERSYFEDSIQGTDPKEIAAVLANVWIAELPEMGLHGKRQAEDWKAFVTRTQDTTRKLHSNDSVHSVPRKFVLAGTINPEAHGYMKDPTGSRRLWPVPVGEIDLESLRRDADLLWGEAVEMYLAGVQWHLTPEEERGAREEQSKRSEELAYVSELRPFLEAKRGDLLEIADVLRFLEVPMERRTTHIKTQVGKAIAALGWDVVKRRRLGSTDIKVYGYKGEKND